ncbi:hypothetical protein ACFLWZ_00450 [Chloroflexota bacterium]
MESTINRTWKPKTAGILNIITGALTALALTFVIIAAISFYNPNVRQFFPPDFDPPLGFHSIVIVMLIIIITAMAFILIGGVFALQRRKWGWALAGCIIAIIPLGGINPLGIDSTSHNLKKRRRSM